MTGTDDGDGWWLGEDDPAASTVPARRLPGRGGWQLALTPVVALVGVLLVVAGAVVLDRRPVGDVGAFPRVSFAEGVKTLRLGAGSYVGYVENAAGARTTLRISPLRGTADIPQVHAYRRELGYTDHARRGQARWTFRIRQPGAFLVRVSAGAAPAGGGVAFGRSVVSGLVVGVGLVLPGALLLTVAAGLLIIGLALRRRARRGAVDVLARHGWPAG